MPTPLLSIKTLIIFLIMDCIKVIGCPFFLMVLKWRIRFPTVWPFMIISASKKYPKNIRKYVIIINAITHESLLSLNEISLMEDKLKMLFAEIIIIIKKIIYHFLIKYLI